MTKQDLPKAYTAVRDQVKNDKRCCGVIALAVAADISFQAAQRKLAKQGRRRNGGTRTYQLLNAIEDCGLTYRLLPLLTERYKTVRSLGRGWCGKRTLLVFTSTHVLAVKDGQVCDWTSNRLHRIKAIYLVE